MDESDQASESNDGRSRHNKQSHGRSEKRRSTLPSPWVLSTAVHGMGAVAKKVVNNRLTESLWSSKRSTPSVQVPSDTSSDHTSKSSLNVADEQTEKLPVSSKTTHEREKTPLRGKIVNDQSENSEAPDGSHGLLVNQHPWPSTQGSNVIDQSDNLKPPYGSHDSRTDSKVIDQSENLKPPDDSHVEHRWPSTSDYNDIDQLENPKLPDSSHIRKTGSNVIDLSENSKPPDGSHVRPVNQHRWPSTTSSNVIDQLENPKPQNSSQVRLVNQHRWPISTGSNVIDQFGISKHPDGSHFRLVNQHRWPGTTGSNVIHHTENLKPTDGSHAKQVNQHLWPSSTGSNVSDQSENLKPLDDSHARLVNQHRWPGTVGSNVLNKNINPPDEAMKTFIIPPSEPSSPTKSYGLTSRGVSPSCTKALTPAPTKDVTSFLTAPASRGANLANSKGTSPSPKVRGVSLTPATRGASRVPTTRGVSLTPLTRRVDPPLASREINPSIANKEVDPSLVTRGVSPSPVRRDTSPSSTSKGVDHSPTYKVIYPTPAVRGASPLPYAKGANATTTAQAVSLLPDNHSPTTLSTPRQSCNSNIVSISAEIDPCPSKEIGFTPTRGVSHSLTTRGVSPTPIARGVIPSPSGRGVNPTPTARGVSPTPTRGVSPTPTRGVGPRTTGVSPTPTRQSSSRLFFNSNLLSIFGKITNSRKEKNVANQKEVAKYLELLYNIQVQWQFVNASAEAALDLQRINAEKSLFGMWRTILKLRESIAAKKIDIDLMILQLKLYAVLYRQMAYIDEWSSIEREHEYALSITTNDLQAKSLRLPITGGVKADIKALKSVVGSSVQVMLTAVSSIQSTLSKLDGTHILASELANVALHERALLDECEIFLASAAPLQVEECSLRSYLIQSNRSCNSE